MARSGLDYGSEDAPVESSFEVTFIQNRSFELKIGRKWYFFGPYGSNTLTQSEINHPDFKQQSVYFNVKEI